MITIAQISDTHIRRPGLLAYGKVDTAAFLRAAVDHINALRPQPDLVLATGDLVDFAEADEYGHFLKLVSPLKAPLWPIPGNHDGPAFWQAFPAAAALRAGPGLGYAVDAGPMRVILVDSSVAGASHGDALEAPGDPARLDWLDGLLASEPDRPVLLALHHPPFATGIGHMDRQNLRNADRLAAVLAGHAQVLALTCGHVHRTVLARFADRPVMICPSPAHAVTLDLEPAGPPQFHMEPPAILLHVWTAGPTPLGTLRSHHLPIGRFDGPYRFFDEGGKLIG